MTNETEAPELDEGLEKDIEASGEKRLTPAEWAQIKELWELGTAEVNEICSRYGVKPASLRKRFLRYGVKKGSRAHELATATAAAAKTTATAAAPVPAAKTAEQLSAERKHLIEKVRKEHTGYANNLVRAAMGRLADAQRHGRAFSTEDGNLKTIERAMKIVRMGRLEIFDLLNAHDEVDENELPELSIRNLTDEQIKALREKQEEDDGDLVEDEDAAIVVDEDEAIVVEEGDDGDA
ncbi:hypothetical protein [Methylobacterium sp. AMS5]|uniref:hypothetical protein n=1 Tax=Methylobacterium sp. AMS5 TaxID=925818 RepID=UPI00074F9B21|nr:hypothetical protein [Methylobacterium sp. AMS5]AMB48275.1 hypothetical protein Y590_25240 [Methylobacterium sp. AMS5]